MLQIQEGEKQLRKPFSSPQDGAPARSKDLLRRLSAKRLFVPWGGGSVNFVPMHLQNIPPTEEEDASEMAIEDAPVAPVKGPSVPAEEAGEPLVLWEPGARNMCHHLKLSTLNTMAWLVLSLPFADHSSADL